jgi:hypothetical protein
MKKQLHVKDLGPRQLWKLRKEVKVNSVFTKDYENSFGIDPKEVHDFFDGYLEGLEEAMLAAIPDYDSNNFFDYFEEYDTYSNLKRWASCVEW